MRFLCYRIIMTYPKDLFQIQVAFAKKVAETLSISTEKALLEYTGFYKLFEIQDWDFNPENEVWKEFLGQIQIKSDQDIGGVAWNFYMQRKQEWKPRISFGCFSYDYNSENKKVHIHFENREKSNTGPLDKSKRENRKVELKDLLVHVQKNHPDAEIISGFSWMYNIEAYKRLFPREYLENMEAVNDWYGSFAIWGQFLDHVGNVKPQIGNQFLNCIQTKESMENLCSCFPYQILRPEVSIDIFYKEYSLLTNGS